MTENKANPNGPQYGTERRDDSYTGIILPTKFLTYAWDLELGNIGRDLTASLVVRHIGRAQGFAWALRAADLINEDVLKAMTEAITAAEQNVRDRIAKGSHGDS